MTDHLCGPFPQTERALQMALKLSYLLSLRTNDDERLWRTAEAAYTNLRQMMVDLGMEPEVPLSEGEFKRLVRAMKTGLASGRFSGRLQ